jgi:hypothetical protein
MFRNLTAFLLLAAAPAAAAPGGGMGDWDLATMTEGCMVQAVSPKGTMLSVWAFAGQPRFGFLLQNREWDSLRDGKRYRLNLDFAGIRSWPVDATARREVDSDGPGLFFTVAPTGGKGNGFLEALASAEDMAIRRDGRRMDTLPLEGSRGAMAALANCLAERWGRGKAQKASAAPDAAARDQTI